MQHTHEGMHEDIKDFSAYKNVIYDADYEQRILQSHHFMIYNNQIKQVECNHKLNADIFMIVKVPSVKYE